MTNRNARNWTSWCRKCNAYTRMAREDRSLCSACRQPYLALAAPEPGPDEELAADAREEAAIVRFLRDVLRKT